MNEGNQYESSSLLFPFFIHFELLLNFLAVKLLVVSVLAYVLLVFNCME